MAGSKVRGTTGAVGGLIDDSGLERVEVDVDDPDAEEHAEFVSRHPAV
jgi:hypothetical protein